MADPIPQRINWLAGEGLTRRAYGYLAFDGEALHLICLRDDSVRAAAAGQAAARQFGLVGALVGAGVSAAREAGRAKELRDLYDAQLLTPAAKRVALNPLSRTIARAQIATLRKGVQIVHALKLTDGTVVTLQSEERSVYPALEEWCASLGVPTEIVLPKPFPWKIVGGIVAVPFVLVALHFVISVPFAFKNQSLEQERIAQYEAMQKKVEPAFASINGLTGHSLAENCGAVLQAPVEQTMAYVGPLPEAAKAISDKSYDYPRVTVYEPPFSGTRTSWDQGRLEVDDVTRSMQWAHSSFGRSYGKVVEQPLGWSRAASWTSLRDISGVSLYIVGKAISVETSGTSYDLKAVAKLSAQVLDAKTGAKKCDGDIAITFQPSTVGLGFMMSQALPLGLLLPSCPKDEGLCHEAHYYAKYAPDEQAPGQVVAEAPAAPTPAKASKTAIKRKKALSRLS